MQRTSLFGVIIGGLLLVLTITMVAAQAGFGLPWAAISGGGGTSSSGSFAVQGSLAHDSSPPLTGGIYTLNGGFWSGLNDEAPTLSAVEPTAARSVVPVALALTGNYFQVGATVTLGTTALENVTTISASRIEAVIPAGVAAGVYALVVRNPDGQSVTLDDAFTVELPNLRILQVQPDQGANQQPVEIVIAGEDFSPAAEVRLGETTLTVIHDSTTRMRATVPAGLNPQAYPLTVITPGVAQATLENAYTVVVQAAAGADNFEPDNTCATARTIGVDGVAQARTFHRAEDGDWVAFSAEAGRRYLLVARPPAGSPASLAVELYDRCEGGPTGGQNNTFSNGVSISFDAPVTGTIYLKVINRDPSIFGSEVAYDLSVRDLTTITTAETRGAVIIVAGKLRDNDDVQQQIHGVARNAYQLFRANGYDDDYIQVLATDPTLDGYDAPATLTNLRNAITIWARERVVSSSSLTIYMVGHGDENRFYVDETAGQQRLEPEQLNEWLNQLETARPGLKVNLIIEACFAGSFILDPGSLSKVGRVVIASSPADNVAYASPEGAYFSDTFLASLASYSLYESFLDGKAIARATYPDQIAWLDDNGNGVPNEAADGQEAQQRSFALATLSDDLNFRPLIVEATFVRTEGSNGTISALVRDDHGVEEVFAQIFPPSYQPPDPQSGLVTVAVPFVTLTPLGNDRYSVTYDGFTEDGDYRIVIQARDNDGVNALPAIATTGAHRVYLPLTLR